MTIIGYIVCFVISAILGFVGVVNKKVEFALWLVGVVVALLASTILKLPETTIHGNVWMVFFIALVAVGLGYGGGTLLGKTLVHRKRD